MTEPTDRPDAPGRIEWLELFFDLVVVAAVAVLSDALRHDATCAGLGIFLVTYGAVWFAWISVVMCLGQTVGDRGCEVLIDEELHAELLAGT